MHCIILKWMMILQGFSLSSEVAYNDGSFITLLIEERHRCRADIVSALVEEVNLLGVEGHKGHWLLDQVTINLSVEVDVLFLGLVVFSHVLEYRGFQEVVYWSIFEASNFVYAQGHHASFVRHSGSTFEIRWRHFNSCFILGLLLRVFHEEV